METFQEFVEASRWRSDANLRKILDKQNIRKGDFHRERDTRANVLKQVKSNLGLGSELPGFKSWLDKLPYRGNPEGEARDRMMQGQQPKHLYRGSMTVKGLKDGGYYAMEKEPIIHASAYPGTATSYSGGKPTSNYRDFGSDVFGTELPKEKPPGLSWEDTPKLLSRFKARDDQRHTYDPGLESGEKGHTPAELVQGARDKNDAWDKLSGKTAETNVKDNKFDGYALYRNRGLDKTKTRRKPQYATVSPTKMQQLLPNLKMI